MTPPSRSVLSSEHVASWSLVQSSLVTCQSPLFWARIVLDDRSSISSWQVGPRIRPGELDSDHAWGQSSEQRTDGDCGQCLIGIWCPVWERILSLATNSDQCTFMICLRHQLCGRSYDEVSVVIACRILWLLHVCRWHNIVSLYCVCYEMYVEDLWSTSDWQCEI